MRTVVTATQRQWHQRTVVRGVDFRAMMMIEGPGFPAIYTSGNSQEQVSGEQITVGQLTVLK